ncbi:MAG: N-acetylmuramoyl-L-alanine amidase [Bacillota bacterium]|nr:N-acetylmuramoyl-L-alanine amidase [Bacillota bacterium]
MERIAIDCGHNVEHDTGAVGIKVEDNLTLAVGSKVITYMKQLGYKVVDCTPKSASSQTQALSLRVIAAGTFRAEFFLSIHFNSGGGHGVEAYAISTEGMRMAGLLCNAIANLGFANRGVKDGSHLYVVRNTSMPAVLLEVAFVDSQSDMALYDSLGPDKIAQAIVTTITGVKPVQAQNDVERWIDSMDIKAVQHVINVLGIKDKNGAALQEDGKEGPLTLSAKAAAKEVLSYIIK